MKKFNILSQSIPSKKVLPEEQIKDFNKRTREAAAKAAENERIEIEKASKVLLTR